MNTIDELRKQVEQIDVAIIEKLAERVELCRQIGQLKSEMKMNVVDYSREKQLFNLYQELCEKHQLSPEFVKQIFQMIITYCRKVQEL
ncbi:MAG: chorismate mutase [Legionellales bacterium]|nr:chorismate mutase [Legionellales bacterium]